MSILVNDVSPRSHYIATAGQTVFEIPFEFTENEHLMVWVNELPCTFDDPPLDAMHYKTTGEGLTGGGNLTFGLPGRLAGDEVIIIRDRPVERTADLPTSGVFPVAALNEDLDDITTMVQQTEVNVQARTIGMAPNDFVHPLRYIPNKAGRAGQVLGFDADGQPVCVDPGIWGGGPIGGPGSFSTRHYIGDNPPPEPWFHGDWWWQSDTGNSFIYYDDGNSRQWVQQNTLPDTMLIPGPAGPTGAAGAGVVPGGTAGQVLTKNSATNYDTAWQTPPGAGGGIGDAPDAQSYVRTLGAWVLGYTKTAADTLLGGKANTSHTHAQADVTGLPAALTAKLDASAYTAADVLTKVKTVDGTGSGLDADLLDGLDSLAFALAGHTHSYASLTGIPSTFAPSTHAHPQGEITNLTTDLALLAPKASPTFTGTVSGVLANFSSNLTAASFISGTYHASGATAGIVTDSGTNYTIRHSTTGTASTLHQLFANANGQVGDIRTSASATAFTTTSDENLKNFLGPYDPELAIAIIRADPVREYTWKVDGSDGIGWGAQTSHAIDPHLALPPPEPIEGEVRGGPGEDGYVPWTVDYGRRTPYLWAALARALDRIDELEQRLAALEAG